MFRQIRLNKVINRHFPAFICLQNLFRETETLRFYEIQAGFRWRHIKDRVTGRAIYNVTPPEASLYFVKTECFCFTEQLLQANESREMPVYYFIQPDLPKHIKEITLSYTFFGMRMPTLWR